MCVYISIIQITSDSLKRKKNCDNQINILHIHQSIFGFKAKIEGNSFAHLIFMHRWIHKKIFFLFFVKSFLKNQSGAIKIHFEENIFFNQKLNLIHNDFLKIHASSFKPWKEYQNQLLIFLTQRMQNNYTYVCLVYCVLWHINLCRLFNAKSIFM